MRAPRARRPRSLVVVTAAAAVVAAALAALISAVVDGDEEPQERAAAARELLAAHERSRLGTYVAVTRFTRTRDGTELTSAERRIVQRPPERVETTATGVRARLDGRRVGCVAGPDGDLSCRELAAGRPYEAVVADEVERLRDQVLGPGRIYNVADVGDGCFRLRLVREIPAPPYGRRARLCFDPATGALVESVVEREGGVVDRTTVVDLRSEVTDDDLELPEEVEGGG